MAKVQPNTLLDNAWDRYLGEVERVAEKVFEEIVKPMLDYANVRLIVSRSWGSWRLEEYVGDNTWRSLPGYELENDHDWQPVITALQIIVPGVPTSDLGSFMKTYPEGAQDER